MAFKLALTTFNSGLEGQYACLLGNFQNFATITPPVTEAAMRSKLETGQFQAFSNDGWLSFVAQMSACPLDESVLTAAERSIVNTLRFIIAPPPQTACCDSTIPAMSDGLSAMAGYPRTGSVTFEHEIEVKFAPTYSCSIKSLEVTLTPVAAEPVVTSAQPFTTTFKSCDAGQSSLFSNLGVTFAADPSGGSYNILYTYKDSNGLVIATYTAAYTLNL
ncbi:hypothetical protein DRO66_06565 [Candidatus Bathyarchaeota archaeon]|nr:MAG: hypothetical protein DRO66_06565 [Candidatus Bathyarchaeota archaeon]